MYFATSNLGKFKEVYSFFHDKGIEINHLKVKIPEPRAPLEEVARQASIIAYERIKAPVFVEDTGLFINSLNGFPGEFSAWVVSKIGIEGILDLMRNKKDRSAYFKTVIAYNDGNTIKLFEGISRGYISESIRGTPLTSLPYDSIFIPEGSEKTFAEDPILKEKVSHRTKALEEFYSFLLSEK